MNSTPLLNPIQNFCSKLTEEFHLIPTNRKKLLLRLSKSISDCLGQEQQAQIIVICTHNSRRSHIGQLWLSISAAYYNIHNLLTYSGGTETTAFHKNGIKALKNIGLKISADNISENPTYFVTWSMNQPPYKAFSKTYDHPINPKEEFIAIMVCSSADDSCPIINGCKYRFALPFNDPKQSDGMDSEASAYDQCVRQIGREFMFAMSNVKQ